MAKPRIPSPIGKWTALKLEYLDNYLQGYVIATKKAKETHYIDAFAGCGECVIKQSGQNIDGSPWRALNAVPRFSQYHFVEKKPAFAAHLRKSIIDNGINNAYVYVGDCNQVIPSDILPKIPRNVPCFAFLDPTGLQLHWTTVRALASHRQGWKVELLILYPYDMAVSRQFSGAKTKPSTAAKITTFYGDESWKTELEQSIEAGENAAQRRERFVKLYTCNLESLGYKFVRPYGPLYWHRRPLYHVIFASDSDVGARIMRDVWAKTRFVPGELGYAPVKRPRTHSDPLPVE